MEIQYSKQALKFLKKQDVPTRKRIINAINLLLVMSKHYRAEMITGFVLEIIVLFLI